MSEVKRGRKPIEINREEFQGVVTTLEQERVFATRTELWEAVQQTPWAKGRIPRPLTAQVALLKAEELGLEVKTAKGKRGKEKGCGPVSVAGRKKKVFSMKKVRESIPNRMKETLEKTVKRAENGSLKARTKLMCLNCSNWQKGEVAMCEIEECPLWDVRPYKRDGREVVELPMA